MLAWNRGTLYAGRGYELWALHPASGETTWRSSGRFDAARWRRATSSLRLTSRLTRDGFHALARLPSGRDLAVVPGAIVTRAPGEETFTVSQAVVRGTRPLGLAVTPSGAAFWGEYFGNAERAEVHVYGSFDGGDSWYVVHTFPRGSVRHVHTIVYDPWEECLWVLTGDEGGECQILRATSDFSAIEMVRSGDQQARAVAAIPTAEGLVFASDTPQEPNYVWRMDRRGELQRKGAISSSSLYGCRVADTLFFSTMAEPSEVNDSGAVRLYGAANGASWHELGVWTKDRWHMRFFQYGNVILPTGDDGAPYLAATPVAVRDGDHRLHLWRVGEVDARSACSSPEVS